jgi:molecular chaperone GrpE
MEDNKHNDPDDDAYVLEDTGASVEDIEHEMQRTAAEAAAESLVNEAAAGQDVRLRSENDELRDRYMRTLADFENFRKRSDREKQDYFRFALADVFRELLPVLDNLDRALEHAEAEDEFHRGVALIYKQMFEVLQRYGLRIVDESGVHFDPNIHEAVMSEQDPSLPGHTVVQILQKGYFLNDRLLRPALVRVAVGGPEEPATS